MSTRRNLACSGSYCVYSLYLHCENDKTLFFVAKLLRFESNRATFRTEEV